MRKQSAIWCLFGIAIWLAACGHKSMVVLVPDPNGSVGQITVSNTAGTVAIDQANHATVIRGSDTPPTTPTLTDKTEIETVFGEVLSRQPSPPVHFILQFESDSDQLTASSRMRIADIVATIAQRAPTRVSAVGHTDTMGDETYNYRLSMRRAVAVKNLLVADGVDEDAIDVSSHGEKNPLVKTADNVASAENRRVEVIVR